MFNEFETRLYRRLRRDGLSAHSAHTYVTALRFEPQHAFLDTLRDRRTVTAEVDGFEVIATMEPDSEAEVSGRFCETVHGSEAAIPNTTPSRHTWYAIDRAEWDDIYDGFRRAGYTRHEAHAQRVKAVEAMMNTDLNGVYAILTVTVSLAGTEVAWQTLGGVVITHEWDRAMALRQLDEMTTEALNRARSTAVDVVAAEIAEYAR